MISSCCRAACRPPFFSARRPFHGPQSVRGRRAGIRPCRAAITDPNPGQSDGDGDGDGDGAAPGQAVAGRPDQRDGCLIATAAYCTELAPQVQALCEIRDTVLLAANTGSAFMAAFSRAYYAVSPHAADLERGHPAFRQAAATALAPALYVLHTVSPAELGSEDSVLAYAAAAIALVAGMYARLL